MQDETHLGLRREKTFEEVRKYIQGNDYKISYPSRQGTFLQQSDIYIYIYIYIWAGGADADFGGGPLDAAPCELAGGVLAVLAACSPVAETSQDLSLFQVLDGLMTYYYSRD